VSRRLREHGAVIVDADLLAREVVAPGTEGLAEVVAAFGNDVLGPDGGLDRPKLGAVVFADPAQRQRLEAIIHPRVRARAAELEADAKPHAVVVHDIPLLVETGQAARFDVVLVVDVPPDVQLDRLTRRRRMTEEEARARIASQATRDDRLAAADVVIDNSGSLADLDARVAAVWGQLAARARDTRG